MIYHAGLAISGGDTRAHTLDMEVLSHATQARLAPGTFNVSLMDTPVFEQPELRVVPYQLWPCTVSTADDIAEDLGGYRGWVLRVDGEPIIGHFVEIISPIHLRTAMNRQNWPSFPVEIALYCGEGA